MGSLRETVSVRTSISTQRTPSAHTPRRSHHHVPAGHSPTTRPFRGPATCGYSKATNARGVSTAAKAGHRREYGKLTTAYRTRSARSATAWTVPGFMDTGLGGEFVNAPIA